MARRKRKDVTNLPTDAVPVPNRDGFFAHRSGDVYVNFVVSDDGVRTTLPDDFVVKVAGSVSHDGEVIEVSALIEEAFPEIAEERLRAEEAERRKLEEDEQRRAEERRREAERLRKQAEDRKRGEEAVASQIRSYWEEVEKRPETILAARQLRERRRNIVLEYREQAEEFGWENVHEIAVEGSNLDVKERYLKRTMQESYRKNVGDLSQQIEDTARRRIRLEAFKGECRERVRAKGPGNPRKLFRRPEYTSDRFPEDWPWITPGEERKLSEGRPESEFIGEVV